MKPELFIGSSVEALRIAEAIEQNLQHQFNITIWTNGVFNIGATSIDDLLEKLEKSDFGLFVFTPDDVAKIREKDFSTIRDNVLYELGLYTGKLGRYNAFIIRPSEVPEDFHLPTDLIGINIGTYDSKRLDNLSSAVSPFCGKIKSQVFNSNKYFLSGKWKFTWEAKGSQNYPTPVSEEVDIFHYENCLKFIHTINEKEEYAFKGVFQSRYFTGQWKDSKDAGYDGVFQMKLNGNGRKFEGLWSGWSNTGGINSGPCSLERL